MSRRVRAVALVSLLGAAQVSCVGRGRAPRAAAACGPVDPAMTATVVGLGRAAPRIAAVWPGFFAPPAFGLYRVDTLAVVVADRAPPGFEPFACPALPAEVARRAWVRRGPDALLQGGIVPLPGPPDFTGAAVRMRGDVTASATLVVHESFHMYEIGHFTAFFDAPLIRALPDTLTLGADFAPRLADELDTLAAAVTAPAGVARRGLLRRYLLLRAGRLAASGGAGAAERSMEMIEGSAQYVGLRAAALAGSGGAASGDAVRQELARDLRASAAAARRDPAGVRDLRPRTYHSGAALAFLLAEGAPGWQRAVERGAPLDSLAAATAAQ